MFLRGGRDGGVDAIPHVGGDLVEQARHRGPDGALDGALGGARRVARAIRAFGVDGGGDALLVRFRRVRRDCGPRRLAGRRESRGVVLGGGFRGCRFRRDESGGRDAGAFAATAFVVVAARHHHVLVAGNGVRQNFRPSFARFRQSRRDDVRERRGVFGAFSRDFGRERGDGAGARLRQSRGDDGSEGGDRLRPELFAFRRANGGVEETRLVVVRLERGVGERRERRGQSRTRGGGGGGVGFVNRATRVGEFGTRAHRGDSRRRDFLATNRRDHDAMRGEVQVSVFAHRAPRLGE